MLNVKMMKKSSAIMLATVLLGSQIITTIPASASASVMDKKIETSQTVENSVEVSSWKELQDAYADSSITSIKLTKDIEYDAGALAVNRGTDFCIEGNGHKLDLGNQVFRVLQSATATFTIKNVSEIKTTASTVTGIVSSGDANVYASSWTINFENVTGASSNRTRLASCSGAQLNLSGDIVWPTSSELAVVDGVKIADNATVISHKNDDAENRSFFWFAVPTFNDTFETKGSREFVVGKNATVDFQMESNVGSYPVVFAYYKQIHLQSGATFNAEMPGNVFRADYYDSSFRADAFNKIKMTSTQAGYSPVDFSSGANHDPSSEFYVGLQSNIDIKAPSGPLFKGTNTANAAKTKITLDSPKNYDLSNTMEAQGPASSVATDNFNEFSIKNADVSIWDLSNSATQPATYQSKDVAFVTQNAGGVVTSSDNKLASYFPTSKLRRISNDKKMEETTINELTTDSTTVSGTGEPGATVEIKVGDQVIGSGTIQEDGTYNIVIPAQKEGTTVEAVATFEGETSAATTIVQASEKDYSITANDFTIGSTYVSGSVGKDVATVNIYVNGKVINKVNATDGKFRAYVSVIHSVSDIVKVVSVDEAGIEKEEAKVNVIEQDLVLTANEYTIGDEYITGKYDKTATKVVLYIDGEPIKMGSLDSATMTYKVAANKLVTSTDQKVEIVMSKGTTELKRVTVKVNEAPVPEYTLTADEYTMGEEYITGNYDKEATKVVLYIDGKDIKMGSLDPATMTYKVAANKLITSADQKVEIVMSKGTTELKRVTVKVNEAPVPEYTLTADEYTIGEEYITGNYDKEATKVVLYIDGKDIKKGSLDPATMTYKVAANKLVTSADQKVEIVMSKGTTELKRVTVKVNEALVPDIH
ncbi:hypothetical protein HB848_06955 [Listeria rocourtiae]|uniref:immunoglobulin-like domain-containing protein n=1 Tax=Listeria rocourtiae TaxID=647910 RepID=UPI001629D800|nr:immunoglobulin-like domain-containing protein [Listeria rocourtiae]MBC1435076.1 hypothetical protein [Listeria rocourtiae]